MVDDEGGARAAAEHLVGLGHREIVVIGIHAPDTESSLSPGGVVARRLRGYRHALAAAAIELTPVSIIPSDATFEGGEHAFLTAWQDGLRPTAVLAMSDATAIGVLQAARHLGLRVPEDVSVVGFDDLPIGRLTDPPLTTVHQPVRLKGAEAARLLLSTIAGTSAVGQNQRVLQTRLVVRRSTAAPGSAAPRR